MIIGITGQTGSGKTTVAQFLAKKYGFHHIEVDKIVEEIMTQGKIDEIKDTLNAKYNLHAKSGEEIGDSFFFYDIDSYIMDLNFKREIDNEILKQVRSYNQNDIILIDWMMLEDSYLFGKCDLLIKTDLDYQTRKDRYLKRGDKFEISKYCCINNIHHSYNASRYHYIVDTKEAWENKLSNFIEQNIFANDLVSIIIPAFNVEQYLMRCVDSVINQSYQNVEIIIVDDGSTDDTLSVAKVLETKDKRVKIIHQENMGLSEARNTGIMASSGEFICFVDADDYIESNMVSDLLKNLKDNDADISCGRAFIHSRSGIVRHPNNNPKEIKNIIGMLDIIDAYLDGTITMAAWDKLYKKSALGNIRFDSNTFNEDADFILNLCLSDIKFVCDTTKYYHYVKRGEDSLTGKKFNERCFLTQKWGFIAYDKLIKLGDSYKQKAEACLFNSLAHVLKLFMRDYKTDPNLSLLYKKDIQLLVNDIINLLLNTNNVDRFNGLDNVLEIIEQLIEVGVLEKEKMPKITVPCIGILWNSLNEEQMKEALKIIGETADIQSVDFVDLGDNYRKFIEEIYLYNNEKVGIPVFKSGVLIDKYDSNTIAIIILFIEVSNYIFYNKKKGYLYKEISDLKQYIRDYFQTKIKDYAYDNIFHLTVDNDEFQYTEEVCKKYVKGFNHGGKNG